jgi:glycerol-3-phosphate dehydrogenase
MAGEADAARLCPDERTAALAALGGAEHQVLVVGGGVVGAGVALDAATRGLSVGLLEERDFGSGTSSASSKLIHGGLRYLEQLNLGLVREALTERGLLLQRIAPHLVRPVPFLFPLSHHVWERAYVGAGVSLYDSLGFSLGQPRGLPSHRQLSRRAALRLAPALKRSAITGAVAYWDAQVDDARYVATLARTAAGYGARLATRTRVTGFLREGERVTGVRAVDLETGAELQLRAQQVVNATGVWTDDIQALVGGRGIINVRASKGVHLVVPRDRIHASTGIITRTPQSVLLVIPWGRHWIVGTTDSDWSGDRARPTVTADDISYLLGQANQVLSVPLTADDVTAVYAGLRPLLAGESEETSRLSREHVVASPVPGLVMVAGGKYTTYRLMARDAVDAVAHGLDWRVPESCTDQVPLAGADGYVALWNARHRIADSSGLHVARIEHLLRRFGSLTAEVLALIAADPGLARPVTGADDYLRAEIVYAASHEGARHLEDVLARRTRIAIETPDQGMAAAAEAAELVARPLRWNARQAAAEVEQYRAAVAASVAVREPGGGALAAGSGPGPDGSAPGGSRITGDSLPRGGH